MPRHRPWSYNKMNDHTAGGLATNSAPFVHKMPWGTMHPTTISAPIVGMGLSGAHAAHVEHQGKRVCAVLAGEKAKDDLFAKVHIAEGRLATSTPRGANWIGNERRIRAAGCRQGDSSPNPGAPVRAATRCATGRSIALTDRLFEVLRHRVVQ